MWTPLGWKSLRSRGSQILTGLCRHCLQGAVPSLAACYKACGRWQPERQRQHVPTVQTSPEMWAEPQGESLWLECESPGRTLGSGEQLLLVAHQLLPTEETAGSCWLAGACFVLSLTCQGSNPPQKQFELQSGVCPWPNSGHIVSCWSVQDMVMGVGPGCGRTETWQWVVSFQDRTENWSWFLLSAGFR